MLDPLIVGGILGAVIAVAWTLWPRRREEYRGPFALPPPEPLGDTSDMADGVLVGIVNGEMVMGSHENRCRSDYLPYGVVSGGSVIPMKIIESYMKVYGRTYAEAIVAFSSHWPRPAGDSAS